MNRWTDEALYAAAATCLVAGLLGLVAALSLLVGLLGR